MQDENTKRELQEIVSPEKIRAILSTHLKGRVLFIKGTDPVRELRIVSLLPGDKNEVLINSADAKDPQPGPVSLYQILGRYLELQCRILRKEPRTGLYIMSVDKAFIAKKQREGFRIPVKDDEIYITNIRTSKNTIDASNNIIPTSVKVNFSLFEQNLKKRADFVKVDVYTNRDILFDEIRKTGKIYYVADTQSVLSYSPQGEDFIDAAQLFGVKLPKKMEDYRRTGIKSEIIFPINYISHDNSPVALGYIQMQSKTRFFDELTIKDLKTSTEALIAKIRDSNTVYIQEKQRVVNISRGGMRVLIDNPQLKDYLIKQKGFTFDIVFKKQAPVTVYGSIRSVMKNDSGELLLGIEITGNSSRPNEMKRFEQNITSLENDYKETLLARKHALEQVRQKKQQ